MFTLQRLHVFGESPCLALAHTVNRMNIYTV